MEKNTTIRKLFYLTSILGFSALVLFVFSYSINDNPYAKNPYLEFWVKSFVPQGYGYFTDNPFAEYQIELYDAEGERIMFSNSHYSYLFGISKKRKKLKLEIATLSARVPDSLWMDLNNQNDTVSWHKIDNENLFYLKNGKYIIIRYKIVPYPRRNIPNASEKQKIHVQTGNYRDRFRNNL